jgi:hypothetical protein
MTEEEIASELALVKRELEELRLQLNRQGSRLDTLPKTMLLDKDFRKRSFAVLGHGIFGYLMIGVLLLLLRAFTCGKL